MLTCPFLKQLSQFGLGSLASISMSLAYAESASRVQTLDEVPKVGNSRQTPEQYRAQLKANLANQRNKLGTQLPSGLTAQSIVNLIAPTQKAAWASLVGAKAWPYRSNSYVAIVCMAPNKAAFDEDRKQHQDQPACGVNKQGKFDKRVYLGLIEYKGAAPRLIASSGKPLALKIGWQASNLAYPHNQAQDKTPAELAPEEYLSFDFAAYKITARDTAIGLRVGWQDEDATGLAIYEALALFAINGDKLENIFAEPMYYYAKKRSVSNGSPDVHEVQNLLSILPAKTDEHFDLKMRTLHGKWKKIFAWDANSKKYVAVMMP